MTLAQALKEKNINALHYNQIGCIVSKDEFQRLTYNPVFDKSEYVCICIHDPDRFTHTENTPNGYPNYTEGFKDVLEVKFWDITKDWKDVTIISDETAREIKEFILKNKYENFIIHCSAGISRSAGVGKAVECITNFGTGEEAKYLYNTSYNSPIDSHPRYSPNLTVFDKIIGV